MRSLKAALLVLSAITIPAIASAQSTRPDYSGVFVLDPAQSDQSPVVPQKLQYTIKQSPADVVVARVQETPVGESTGTLRFTLDGTLSINESNGANGPMKVKTTVTWEAGGAAVFTSDTDTGIHQVDRWTLIDGGKKLQIDRTVAMGDQGAKGKMTLVRQ
jgi:hypothetical protein